MNAFAYKKHCIYGIVVFVGNKQSLHFVGQYVFEKEF